MRARPGRPTTHIVLLRGINVGTSNRIAMADLRDMLSGLGFTGVRTLLASGNVVVHASSDDPAEVARTVRQGIADTFGLSIPVVVRSHAQIERVIERNPMAQEAEQAPNFFHVGFSDPLPTDGAYDVIDANAIEPDRLVVDEGTLYLWFAEGPRGGALAKALSRNKLHADVTMRNWNTVQKLVGFARS